MKQQCYLAMVWLTWLLAPLVAVLVALRAGLIAGSVVLAAGVIGEVLCIRLYIRWFPHISRWMGYGSVADTPPAAAPTGTELPRVTLYTASLCPFCPIIRARLAELQRQSGLEIREVDVTFRPEIVRAKGLRSVPVLEANGRLLVGNATSAQIVEFLKTASGERSVAGS